jgi:PAS domain S-box-containing protein
MVVDAALLERVLDQDELQPCFQPLVELRTGRLIGFELLARWRHPDLGLILPDGFIEVAEQTDQLGRLTHQILRKAFLSAPVLPEPLRLSVNFSPVQLKDLNLPEEIFKTAQESSFPMSRLTIEITETALVESAETAEEITRQLKAMGCRLVLDDFGTGYSNFKHLQTMNFDGLKIDKSFTANITRTRESRKIVAALIGLGQSLGLTTVAEGIESEEQAGLLLYLGCDAGQGWHFGHPVPAAEVQEVVRALPQPPVPIQMPEYGDQKFSSLESLPVQRLAQLQAIYDGAPVGLCFLNRSLTYVSVNRCFAEINDVPALSMIGQSVKARFPHWFPLYEPYLLRALGGEALEAIEITRPSLTGGENQTLLLSYEPAWDEAHEVIGISMAVMDISQRKRNEAALLESEERYRMIIDLNPQMPWILNMEGGIIDYGSRWNELTGMTRESSLGLGWLDALHAEDVGPTMAIIESALKAREPFDFEYRIKRPGGDLMWMRTRGAPRFDPDGEVHRYYGSVENIDSTKEMQASLRRCQQKLRDLGAADLTS